ncbi:hypothetical protein [Microbacterium plantarum]|uniref:hypothetical protein n=1 Tax=Microbacterium plantarum TaxID=1816425 RepID=UPI002B46FCD3|nr:hypothetical protein [Microbacterium plantarum]WRK16927.1 hypothetical protein VC184_13600 [Microbacterium plantarum]
MQGFTANGMCFEAKPAFAGLLFSEWADGNVSIERDSSSRVNGFTYADNISISLENVPGVMYHFHDSHLPGGIKVKYAVNAWQAQHFIVFSNTVWRQRFTPSEVVTWDGTGRGGGRRPRGASDGSLGELPWHHAGRLQRGRFVGLGRSRR